MSNILDGSELFQTRAQQAAPPVLPSFTIQQLLDVGITFVATDQTKLLTIPMKAQRFLAEAVKPFGFGTAKALDELLRRIIFAFGLKGHAKLYTTDGLDFCAFQGADPRRVAPAKLEAQSPIVVGLVGLRRSGKDTAAQALVEDGFENVKFAGALKVMLLAYLQYRGCPEDAAHELIEGDSKEEQSYYFETQSPRFAMQTIGTEWGREIIGKDIWVNAALDQAKQHPRVVISDVRFPNEVEAIRSIGGKIIRVTRPNRRVDSHPSESMIHALPTDYEIFNGGTIEQLHANVRAAVTELTATTTKNAHAS